jgi:hypothetical protein
MRRTSTRIYPPLVCDPIRNVARAAAEFSCLALTMDLLPLEWKPSTEEWCTSPVSETDERTGTVLTFGQVSGIVGESAYDTTPRSRG